jgi:ubiquinone/menaquinone biosynthesis C-methylase UbiE
MTQNLHKNTVEGFGDEWERFDQSTLSPEEHQKIFDDYFAIFPWQGLAHHAEGFDLGCGSGRWAKLVAPKVGKLHCIDPSSALEVAKRNLKDNSNCEFHQASVDTIPLANSSMDFGYSLGVLHHIPDTQAALSSCVAKLKPCAPFLVYLYYAFDNRPLWFRILWKISDFLRLVISRLPHSFRFLVTQILAVVIYYPLARTALILEKMGVKVEHFPLSAYRQCSFYTMRTDALDRFGTQLEQRFTRKQIQNMMETAGLENISFSENVPFWCAVGFKKH